MTTITIIILTILTLAALRAEWEIERENLP